MIKTLAKSIREYKKQTILTPIFVALEVIMEILRAKTKELFKSALDETQQKNSLLNMQEMESGAVKLNAYPRRIVLEMTSACNIKCIFCGRDEAEFNQTYLKIDVLDKLIRMDIVCKTNNRKYINIINLKSQSE